jgi:hypothetical protein
MGFGLVTGFIDHLYAHKSQLQPRWSTHPKDHCNCSTNKVFFVFTSRFLVTDLNTVL